MANAASNPRTPADAAPASFTNPQGSRASAALPSWFLVAFVVIGGLTAYFSIFSRFLLSDDEGYLLISLRQFMQGHPLYDEVFSQYGPFYYLLHGAIFGIARLTVSHDAMRLLLLAQVIGIALLSACIVFRMTGSRWLLAITFPITLAAIQPFLPEPAHPQSLALLLLLCLALAASRVQRPMTNWSAAIMGALVGCLLMTKINVGIFALLALAWTAALFTRSMPAKGLGLLTGLAIITLPWLIMGQYLGEIGSLEFALTISASFLQVALCCFLDLDPESLVGKRQWLFAIGACLIVVILVALANLLWGTSLSGLIRGIAWRPGKTKFLIPANFDSNSVTASALSLVFCFAVRGRRQIPGSFPFMLTMVLKACLGLLMVTQQWPGLLERGLPFIWIGLIVPPAAGDPRPVSFGRVFLVSLTVVHALVAYPVAGTQSAVAVVPLVLVAALCLHDALQMWNAWAVTKQPSRRSALICGFIAVLLVVQQCFLLATAFDRYQHGVPLELPGTRLVRLPAADAERLQRITAELRGYDTFISAPGMNSLYFFAEKEPPTSLNCSAWMFLVRDEDQQMIVEALKKTPSACAVYDRRMLWFWGQGRNFDETPLMKFLTKEYRLLKTVGGFEIHTRVAPP